MSEFVNTVEIVGDTLLTKSIIDRTISEFNDNVITKIGSEAFKYCKVLKSVNFPNVTQVNSRAFIFCSVLEKADFGSCVNFSQYCFQYCSKLSTLILRNADQMSVLTSSYCLNYTAIESKTGYIYVPSALVDSYKAASGWSTYADQIRAIEDYPEVCDPYSWPVVFQRIEEGTYTEYYKVGDLVPLDLGSEGVVNMQIAAFDTDTLADGSGTAPITWISKGLLPTAHRMNPALITNDDGTYQEGTGSIGGWEKCEMRTYLQSTVKSLIPENVREKIKPVTKYSVGYDTAGTCVTNAITQDDIWIPSWAEAYGIGNYETLGVDKYDIFEATGYANHVKLKDNAASRWGLRTARNTSQFRVVNADGGTSFSYVNAENDFNIALGFCT